MKKINSKLLVLCAGAALIAASARAQQSGSADTSPASSFGLIGQNYASLGFGYVDDKDSAPPSTLREYSFLSNQAVIEKGTSGVDADLLYTYLTGDAFGYHDYRQDAEVGLTGYLLQSWAKPFASADVGWAWQNAGGVHHTSLAYTLSAGAEFHIAPPVVLTPYVEYQAEPQLHNDVPALGNLYDHDWSYGVKANYRFTHAWSLSLGAQLDQHRDIAYLGGVNFHY